MSNPLYNLQEQVEVEAEKCINNALIKVLSRRKGHIKNDIDTAMAKANIAVIVSTPLPQEFSSSGARNLFIDKAVIGLQITENVVLNKTGFNAFDALVALGKHFNNACIDVGNGDQITFRLLPVQDTSPDEKPELRLLLPLEFSIVI